MEKRKLQQKVIDAAISLCDNAAFLPDGNAQVPTDLAEALGDALLDLANLEQKEYSLFLKPGQQGLNSVQVALQRVEMPEEQLKIERAIDAADQIYLGLFDQLTLPALKRRGFSEPNPEGIVKYPPTCSNSLT